MKNRMLWAGGAVALLAAVFAVSRPAPEAKTPPPEPRAEQAQGPRIVQGIAGTHYYYPSAEAAGRLPETLSPAAIRVPEARMAYAIAQRIPEVLVQQPCLCACDGAGHRSLLDCYVDRHGENCLICIKEAVLAERLTNQGKSPAEIRAAIVAGGWREVNFGL